VSASRHDHVPGSEHGERVSTSRHDHVAGSERGERVSTSRHDHVAGPEQRRRDALAHQLHAVIRHKSAPSRPDPGQLLERAICVFDELVRATRITARVWSETFHAIRQDRSSRLRPARTEVEPARPARTEVEPARPESQHS
jgi:hypothetical protein